MTIQDHPSNLTPGCHSSMRYDRHGQSYCHAWQMSPEVLQAAFCIERLVYTDLLQHVPVCKAKPAQSEQQNLTSPKLHNHYKMQFAQNQPALHHVMHGT